MTSALLDPERQFLGCLMQLPLTHARRVLTGMCPGDLADPTASFVLHLAIRAVANDQRPAPVVLFEHAQEIAERPRASRLREVALWLADVYQAAPAAPVEHAAYLKAVVLKAAWRRAVAEHAHRLLQAASESATGELHELLDDTTAVDDLWSRYQAARNPNSVSARLEVAA
ncbi:hypothetical protein ORV05_34705 [Amycolatopsis cynarae]|uniref:DnaB-like helicase N terminal domain-containing protein n=1 Tax=Amycolatopsis cynarae TaxID=2995223 RepID=A0ABY7B3Z1_9PSEU|nr:hypothetical protein [Amycolatopsis sp. HUAS 11-8]WAL65947.1 hypothetical protein ORV05_34705 [Amycolatopsis sp. HUAS 11-8]